MTAVTLIAAIVALRLLARAVVTWLPKRESWEALPEGPDRTAFRRFVLVAEPLFVPLAIAQTGLLLYAGCRVFAAGPMIPTGTSWIWNLSSLVCFAYAMICKVAELDMRDLHAARRES